MGIKLVTLGVLRCVVDGKENTSLASQRQRLAVLLYLALERDTTREKVMAVFWPERETERARHALSQTIYDLRRALGDGWLKVQGDHLIVTEAVEVDTELFESAIDRRDTETALSLYGGEFLSGEYLADTKEFEEWVDERRALIEGLRPKLKQLHRTASREKVNQLTQSGDLPAALLAARHWVEFDPTEDEAQHALIELLAHSGQRAEALKQYGLYENALNAEGLKPLDDTVSLAKKLRASEVGLERVALSNATPIIQSRKAELTIPQPLPTEPGRRRWFGALVIDRPAQIPGVGHRSRLAIAAVALLTTGVLIRDSIDNSNSCGNSRMVLDTTLYLVLPFARDVDIAPDLHEDERLFDAFDRWQGIDLANPFLVNDALARRGMPTSSKSICAIAQELGAGRVVRSSISRRADGVRVQSALFDPKQATRPLRRFTVIIDSMAQADSVFNLIADSLLISGIGQVAGEETVVGTTSLPARNAYLSGQAALKQWNLRAADSLFAHAIRFDPGYTRAYLWLAQVRGWASDHPLDWRDLTEQVERGRDRLSPRERQLATAIVHLARNEFNVACLIYKSLTQSDPRDFAAWYGLGECHSRDDIVVRDSASLSGWRFRSSYHQAVQAYRHAFKALPSSLLGFRGDNYSRIRRLLFIMPNQLRPGHTRDSDTVTLRARPSWQGDSLAFVPFARAEVNAAVPRASSSPTVVKAVLMHQEIFHDVAKNWAATAPGNADALAMLALSLEMLGNPAALDTVRLARSLARDPKLQFRLAVSEVFLLAKFNLPSNPKHLATARELADSLLRAEAPADPASIGLLASLAALTGKAHRTAILAAHMAELSPGTQIPSSIASPAQALLAYCVLGAPVDSIGAFAERVRTAIRNHISPQERSTFEGDLMGRSARLAFLAYAFDTRSWATTNADYLLRAQRAYQQHDTVTIDSIFRRIEQNRQNLRPPDIMADGLLPEAELLLALGRPYDAIQWIDPTLKAAPVFAPDVLDDFVYAGSIVRLASLRAQLAALTRDHGTARKWAAAVLALWQGADLELQPAVTQMRKLANAGGQ